jgi:hypothetical protein
MDPIVSKVASKSGQYGGAPEAQGTKNQPSKFDQVREQVGAIKEIAPAPSNSQTQTASRLAQPDSVDGIRNDFTASRNQLDRLTERITASPQAATLEPLRKRLLSLESQYQQVGSAVDRIGSPANPERLLQLQQDVYRLNESLGIVSRVVDQVTSGIKSVLQTQI